MLVITTKRLGKKLWVGKEIILIKNIKYKKGHVMVFACKYFNSKHKHISQLSILAMSLFDWPSLE
jgi:hypothetical protein